MVRIVGGTRQSHRSIFLHADDNRDGIWAVLGPTWDSRGLMPEGKVYLCAYLKCR